MGAAGSSWLPPRGRGPSGPGRDRGGGGNRSSGKRPGTGNAGDRAAPGRVDLCQHSDPRAGQEHRQRPDLGGDRGGERLCPGGHPRRLQHLPAEGTDAGGGRPLSSMVLTGVSTFLPAWFVRSRLAGQTAQDAVSVSYSADQGRSWTAAVADGAGLAPASKRPYDWVGDDYNTRGSFRASWKVPTAP